MGLLARGEAGKLTGLIFAQEREWKGKKASWWERNPVQLQGDEQGKNQQEGSIKKERNQRGKKGSNKKLNIVPTPCPG